MPRRLQPAAPASSRVSAAGGRSHRPEFFFAFNLRAFLSTPSILLPAALVVNFRQMSAKSEPISIFEKKIRVKFKYFAFGRKKKWKFGGRFGIMLLPNRVH